MTVSFEAPPPISLGIRCILTGRECVSGSVRKTKLRLWRMLDEIEIQSFPRRFSRKDPGQSATVRCNAVHRNGPIASSEFPPLLIGGVRQATSSVIRRFLARKGSCGNVGRRQRIQVTQFLAGGWNRFGFGCNCRGRFARFAVDSFLRRPTGRFWRPSRLNRGHSRR